MIRLKIEFRTKCPYFITPLTKLLLSKEEEKLACLVIAYYEISLEQDMIINSVTLENFEWLFYVWAFEKNYIG